MMASAVFESMLERTFAIEQQHRIERDYKSYAIIKALNEGKSILMAKLI